MGVNEFVKSIRNHQKIALDTSCFIYQFEDHATYVDLTTSLFDYLEEEVGSIFSAIGITELLTVPQGENNSILIRSYKTILLNFPGLVITPITFSIAELAAQLRVKYAIRTPDALHLASAMEHEATCFISNDKKLNKVEEISVLCLDDYM